MINELRIRNIALIEEVSVGFHEGLEVLSGETGAGKSIIVDAVTLILGGRADKGLIRTGCEKAWVEADFLTEENPALAEKMEREGIDFDGRTLTVFREISLSGRNVCRINGVMIPLGFLKEIAGSLLNLHGQSEHQFLADPEMHLAYLDLMGDERHRELKEKTAEAYQVFIANHRAYAKLVKKNENKDLRLEKLKRELEELHEAEIEPGEEEKLQAECRHLEQAARIHGKVAGAYGLMISGEDGNGSMYNLQQAAKALRPLSEENEEFGELADKIENLYYELEDVAYRLSGLKDRFDFDPNRLDSAENRLESIRKIERKYGATEEEVLQAQKEREEEYEALCNLEDELARMGTEHKRLLAAYRGCARELTKSRKEIAERFREQMMTQLKDLGMEHTIFETEFKEEEGGKPRMPSPEGDDRIEFLISPNPGQPLKPLAKIASGGELSRMMLAMKAIESGRGKAETMIFDEIDTGISGRMAQAVAEKMIMISRKQQVICISHLPQIAAAADHQYLVHKEVLNGRTVTDVREMSGEERTGEVARMISGAGGVTEDAKAYAARMIEESENRKKEMKTN